jgi:hypothetical protein
MLTNPPEGQVFVKVKDEYGNEVPFVQSVDTQLGFIIAYDDLAWDQSENKFKVKTMRVKRIYCKFSLGASELVTV